MTQQAAPDRAIPPPRSPWMPELAPIAAWFVAVLQLATHTRCNPSRTTATPIASVTRITQ